jgi:methylenetetrahydrofolate dehydrogenase (NADP+)/methenyltetrahydrofolate cyclohydrolase
VDGFIVQMPLPKHINEQKVIEAIDKKKDVDGFHPVNVGRMVIGLPAYISATPDGIVDLLHRYKIETAGKHCVVLGRSNIVGRPIANLLSLKANPGDCTVTVCHSRTPNIKEFTKTADILIVALGRAEYVTADMVKEGAVVVDVGITRLKPTTKSGWNLGDVKFDEVPKCTTLRCTKVLGHLQCVVLKNTLKAQKKSLRVTNFITIINTY